MVRRNGFQLYVCAVVRVAALAALLCLVAPAQEAPAPPAQPASAADKNKILTSAEIQALIARVAEANIAAERLRGYYTYTQETREDKLDGKGNVKESETRTSEILVIAGSPVERLIAKNGQPLSAHDAAKEEEKIQKVIDQHKNESERDRQKREEKEAKDREEGRKFVREIGNAFTFTHTGYETVNGWDTYVIEAEPRPEFVGHEDGAKYLNKFRMKGWIATSEPQLVKLEAEAIDTLSFGLFLARVHKGTRFSMVQTKVNDEVWLPSLITAKVDARIALFKGVNEAVVNHYSGYKRFRTESRITAVGDVQEPDPPKQ